MSKFNWGVNKTILQSEEVRDRLSALTEIRFKYSGKPVDGYYCCAKVIVGRKYCIVKTKTIQWLEKKLNEVLKEYNINGSNDMYLPIVKHVHNTGVYDVQVDIIKQSDNPYEVIKAEYLALASSKGDKMCLNQSFEPYMPKWNATKKLFGWLTMNQFLNYKKLAQRHPMSESPSK